MQKIEIITQKFPLGRLVATPGAIEKITPEQMLKSLLRHAKGDWGDLDEEDIDTNERSVACGMRILSSYNDPVKHWIITEHDRSVTTVLLPDEY